MRIVRRTIVEEEEKVTIKIAKLSFRFRVVRNFNRREGDDENWHTSAAMATTTTPTLAGERARESGGVEKRSFLSVANRWTRVGRVRTGNRFVVGRKINLELTQRYRSSIGARRWRRRWRLLDVARRARWQQQASCAHACTRAADALACAYFKRFDALAATI